MIVKLVCLITGYYVTPDEAFNGEEAKGSMVIMDVKDEGA